MDAEIVTLTNEDGTKVQYPRTPLSAVFSPDGGTTEKWIKDLISAKTKDLTDTINAIAEVYDATKTYSIDKYIQYNGAIYKCTTEISTPESFNVNHWTKCEDFVTTILEELAPELTACKNATSAANEAAENANEAANNANSRSSILIENNTYPVDVSWVKNKTTWNGITFSWNDNVCNVSGTATANSFVNIYNGSLPCDNFNVILDSADEHIYVRIYFTGGSEEKYITFKKSSSVSVPDGYTGVQIRLLVFSGVTVSGTISLKLLSTNSASDNTNIVPYIIPDSGCDCTDAIISALENHGCVYLDKGEYIVTDLEMPDNTRITGKGRATKVKVSSSGHHAIKCGSGCTIDNLEIVGINTTYSSSKGTDCGIYIEGNGDETPFVYNTKISNVTIHGFNLAGIYIYNTGAWCANSVSVVNCEIYWCYAGIYTDANAEFGRYSNIISRNNYAGCRNDGGNNVFVGCTFTNNIVGFLIHKINAEQNGCHGSCIGCQINHSYNNNGNAIIVNNALNGFVFEGCQIWYGKISIENTDSYTGKPVIFNACEFGGGTPTITTWARTLMSSCVFCATPTFSGWADNRGLTIVNCYDAEMNAVTKS